MSGLIQRSGISKADQPVSKITSSNYAGQLTHHAIETCLRQKRSKTYIDAITHKLDSGGHVLSREALDKLTAAIRSELPELALDSFGIVAKCFLGPPFEVHTLDLAGSIIRHYKTFEPLPPLLERARVLALHPGYQFIEVYMDKLIAVAANGDTSIVKG